MFSLVLLFGCGPKAAPAPAAEPGPVALGDVEPFLQTWSEAFVRRDAAAIRALYADDGRLRWVEQGEVRYRSVDEIVQSVAQLPAGPVSTDLSRITVASVAEGGALVNAAFTTRFGEGDDAFVFGGFLSLVLERKPAPPGWRIVGGHSSSPPAPVPVPLRTERD